jgi:glycosyltransferase involved in cell wall biosynthesis
MEYLINRKLIDLLIRNYLNEIDAVILRLPGMIGNITAKLCKMFNIPYSIELVGDPYELYSPGAISHPMRCYFRWYFTKMVKEQCKEAIAVSYVTNNTLQKKYPTGKNSFSTSYSSISISSGTIIDKPRNYYLKNNANIDILTIGSLQHLYKGVDTLIESIKLCKNRGVDAKLTVIGGGRYQEYLRNFSKRSGVNENVFFTGHITDRDVLFKYIDDSELFVLASRTEGLPKVMVEAMARGLPCIGTEVGGVPELISSEFIVPPNDPISLANKILNLIRNPDRLISASESNIRRAREYTEDMLRSKRIEYYTYVKDKSAERTGEVHRKITAG